MLNARYNLVTQHTFSSLFLHLCLNQEFVQCCENRTVTVKLVQIIQTASKGFCFYNESVYSNYSTKICTFETEKGAHVFQLSCCVALCCYANEHLQMHKSVWLGFLCQHVISPPIRTLILTAHVLRWYLVNSVKNCDELQA